MVACYLALQSIELLPSIFQCSCLTDILLNAISAVESSEHFCHFKFMRGKSYEKKKRGVIMLCKEETRYRIVMKKERRHHFVMRRKSYYAKKKVSYYVKKKEGITLL